jgi:hypothetical protein
MEKGIEKQSSLPCPASPAAQCQTAFWPRRAAGLKRKCQMKHFESAASAVLLICAILTPDWAIVQFVRHQ